MVNLGQCPKCAKTVLHVRIENIRGLVGEESNALCLSYSCIHCNAVLGVQLDLRAKSRPRKVRAASQ